MDQPATVETVVPPIEPEAPPVEVPETPAPQSPPAEPSDVVTMNRAEYDRLQNSASVAERLAPLAEQIERDPFFAQRLMNTQAGPAAAQPETTDYSQYNDSYWDNPGDSTARITERVVEKKFLPQVEATARALQLQYNRLAIENFRMNKRSSDAYSAGIMPIFEQAVARTTDDELSKMDGARLNQSLTVAWDMATGQYFRGLAAKAPKEQAPPIGGAPAGAAPGSRSEVKPSGPEWEYCLSLARSLGKDEAYALKVWRESAEEAKAANG